jgi:hypothetical protein
VEELEQPRRLHRRVRHVVRLLLLLGEPGPDGGEARLLLRLALRAPELVDEAARTVERPLQVRVAPARAAHAPARPEHLRAHAEDLGARVAREPPQVRGPELRGLVRERVRVLRERLGGRALALDVREHERARLERRGRALVRLVLRVQRPVRICERGREQLWGGSEGSGTVARVADLETGDDVLEMAFTPAHDQQLATQLHIDPHAVNRKDADIQVVIPEGETVSSASEGSATRHERQRKGALTCDECRGTHAS